MRRFLLASSLLVGASAAAFGQVTTGGGGPGVGTGTSSGVINAGTATFSANVSQFIGTDGTLQGQIFGSSNAVDYFQWAGGRATLGPTFACLSTTDTSVICNYAAKGSGGHFFGNDATGALFSILNTGITSGAAAAEGLGSINAAAGVFDAGVRIGATNFSVFTTPGTATFAFPAYATQVCYLIQGGGSSGADGHAQTAGTGASGGAGGSGGGTIPWTCVPASSLTSPVTVTVGSGGASPSTDGSIGNVGTQSCFGINFCVGGGGAPSGGAQNVSSASGAAGSIRGVGPSASGATAGTGVAGTLGSSGTSGGVAGTSGLMSSTGGNGISTGAAGSAAGFTELGAGGGGGGGGLASTQVALNGGNGGAVLNYSTPTGGVAGTNNGDAAALTCTHDRPGMGGGGGASSATATRGGNGAGGCDGGGGGGGGDAPSGQQFGIGGPGGNGIVLATWR